MRLAIAIFAALLGSASAARTQEDEPVTRAATAPLRAEALAYASELEKQTPKELRNWARKQARNLLGEELDADGLSAESLGKLFPAQPAATRAAIGYLIG